MLNISFFLIKHNIWEIFFGFFYFTELDWANAFRFGPDPVWPWTVKTLSTIHFAEQWRVFPDKREGEGGRTTRRWWSEGWWKRRRLVTPVSSVFALHWWTTILFPFVFSFFLLFFWPRLCPYIATQFKVAFC